LAGQQLGMTLQAIGFVNNNYKATIEYGEDGFERAEDNPHTEGANISQLSLENMKLSGLRIEPGPISGKSNDTNGASESESLR
jgi:hypothetical protein